MPVIDILLFAVLGCLGAAVFVLIAQNSRLSELIRSQRDDARARELLAQKFAINLLPFLNRGDLASVCDDESLAPTLRLAAQRLLELPGS